jgi:Cu(I)/Ag(I) efflux system membrane fusion protein
VFVTHQLGKFEPREIITGLVGNGHRTEVLSGLSAGETVVTSGQFLLDSESQLQEALAKLGAARLQIQPKTAAEARHDRTRGASPQTGAGDTETSWTCAMHPQIVQDAPGECPVCGMSLVEQKK